MPPLFLEKILFSLLNYLSTFGNNQLTTYVQIYFRTLPLAGSLCLSLLQSHCLERSENSWYWVKHWEGNTPYWGCLYHYCDFPSLGWQQTGAVHPGLWKAAFISHTFHTLSPSFIYWFGAPPALSICPFFTNTLWDGLLRPNYTHLTDKDIYTLGLSPSGHLLKNGNSRQVTQKTKGQHELINIAVCSVWWLLGRVAGHRGHTCATLVPL